MCAYGGIKDEGGGAVVLTILLFQKILSTTYVYGDGNTTCVHTRNSIKKKWSSGDRVAAVQFGRTATF